MSDPDSAVRLNAEDTLRRFSRGERLKTGEYLREAAWWVLDTLQRTRDALREAEKRRVKG